MTTAGVTIHPHGCGGCMPITAFVTKKPNWNFTGASNDLAGITVTPIELLSRRWQNVYTWPQTTQNQLAFLTANGSYNLSDTLAVHGNMYYREFWQKHVDANTSELTPSDVGIPDTFPPKTVFGEIDRTSTAANSFGGSVQVTSTGRVLDHENHFVVGTSVDRGRVQYSGNSEFGTIGQDLFVSGTGVFIDDPGSDVAPVQLLAKTQYTGIYATDTLDLTEKLAVTACGPDRNGAQRQRSISTLQSRDRRDL
jgi:iron complex outermembrane recepter protein